ncbi:MAG: hypothetical protein ACRDSZ_18190 [Pseudonocardiaceae bacterium]
MSRTGIVAGRGRWRTTSCSSEGFCNLRLAKVDGGIVLDPHVTGACVIVFDEAAATQLFDVFRVARVNIGL